MNSNMDIKNVYEANEQTSESSNNTTSNCFENLDSCMNNSSRYENNYKYKIENELRYA